MIKEAIEKLQALVEDRARSLTFGDKHFVTREVFNPPHPREDPTVKTTDIVTLTGFVDFVKTKLPADQREKHFIHVAGPGAVLLMSDPFGFHKQRECLVKAKPVDLFTGGFQFNSYVPHSSFMIAIQTLFQEANDWEKVTKVISTIKEEKVTQSQDNGLAQTVVARAGVAVVSEVEAPRIVTLKPYRTFREVEQPHSQFVLRLQAKPNELPQVGLFEADGGKWKTSAIENIRVYLEEQLGKDFGLPIIA